MTRPKWERQRDKAFGHLKTILELSYRRGRFDFDDEKRKIHFHISFMKDGKIDEILLAQFFAASYAILKNWYSVAHKDQKGKKLINEHPQFVTLNSVYATYSKWNEIQTLIKTEKMKVGDGNIAKSEQVPV